MQFADSIEARALPPVVAVQAAQIDRATDAVARLKALLDLYENHLRLVAALAVGELRHRLPVVPEELARELLSDLPRPTWDDWFVIFRKAATFLTDSGIEFELAPDIQRFRKLTNELRNCRNESSHGPVRSWAEQKFNEFAPQIIELFRTLPWLRQVSLGIRVTRDGRDVRLSVGQDLGVDLSGSPITDAVVVARLNDHDVSLYPFIVLMQHSSHAGRAFLGVYTALEESWEIVRAAGLAEQSPAPLKLKHKKHNELAAFRSWCRYEERDTLLGALRDFDSELNEPPPIYGRSEQRKNVVSLVKASRVVWIESSAGLGKSLFLQHVASNLRSDQWRVIYWRFQVGDHARSAQLPFLKHLASRLRRYYGQQDDRPPRLGDDPRAWEQEVRKLLEAPAEPLRATVVVLDGLDECDDDWLRNSPFTLEYEGLNWLCAGRPMGALPRIFSTDRCTRFEDLAALKPEHVKEWIEQAAPDLVPRVAEIVERSEGLPQWIRLLLSEFDSGFIDAAHPLPRGMPAFWKEAIDRAWKRCATRVRGFCLKALQAVAISVEPVSVEMVHEVLRRTGEFRSDRVEDNRARITDAMAAMRSLLVEERRDSVACFRASHASLVDLLREDEEYLNEHEAIVHAMVALAKSPTGVDRRIRSEVFRRSIRQLVAVEHAVPDAVEVLTTFSWLTERLFVDGSDDGAPMPHEVQESRRSKLYALLDDLTHLTEHLKLDEIELTMAMLSPSETESRLHAILELRRFVARRLLELAEDGVQQFFQFCANGEVEYLRAAAFDWKRRHQTAWTWLEFVGCTIPDVSRHMLVELTLEHKIAGMMFEPDEKHLLVTHVERDATRWEASSGRQVGVITGLRGRMLGFVGRHLYVEAQDDIETWSFEEGRVERLASQERPGMVLAVWRDGVNGIVIATQTASEALLTRAHDGVVVARCELPPDLAGKLNVTLFSPDTRLVELRNTIGACSGVTAQGVVSIEMNGVCAVDEQSEAIIRMPNFQDALEVRELSTLALRETIRVEGLHQMVDEIRGWGRVPFGTDRATSAGLREGDYVPFAFESGALVLFNCRSRRAKWIPGLHSRTFAAAATLSSSGRLVATRGHGEIRIWTTDGLAALEPVQEPLSPLPVMLIAIAPTADRIACVREESIEWRRFTDGRLIETTRISPYRGVGAVSFNGACFAIPDRIGVSVFDTTTGRRSWLPCEDVDGGDIEQLSLDTDGSNLELSLSSGSDSAWKVPSGERIIDWSKVPLGPARGRHLDSNEQQPFHYEDRDGLHSRRTVVVDFGADIRTLKVGDTYSIHGRATWWGGARITACAVAQDGRVVIATEDGQLTFLRYRRDVPVTLHVIDGGTPKQR